MALSISAAVVPAARFFATTIYGPAIPRIEIADTGFDEPTMLNWELRAGDEAEAFKAERSRSLRSPRAAFGPRGGAALPVFADGLFKECRSCVHSALTLPGAGLFAIAALGFTDVEMLRCGVSDA
jgi:hypothetical protein